MAGEAHDGIVNDLLADARRLGHPVTPRLITDWVARGLLDHPQRRSRGRGHGSTKAVYPAAQRQLFEVLLTHRAAGGRVSHLAAIPIAIWVYWGDEYVPLRQARRALLRWLYDYRRTMPNLAAHAADQLLDQIGHPDAAPADRYQLRQLLTHAISSGHITGVDEMYRVVQRVFDPYEQGRTLGPPAAPLTPQTIVDAAVRREAAAVAVQQDRLPDPIWRDARNMLRAGLVDYLRQQPELAAQAGELADLFAAPALDQLINGVVPNLLFALGVALDRDQSGGAS